MDLNKTATSHIIVMDNIILLQNKQNSDISGQYMNFMQPNKHSDNNQMVLQPSQVQWNTVNKDMQCGLSTTYNSPGMSISNSTIRKNVLAMN